jgi:hypothetical protein
MMARGEEEEIDLDVEEDNQYFFDTEEEKDNFDVFFDREGYEDSEDTSRQYNNSDDSGRHEWYSLMKPILNHINAMSKRLLWIPGLILSLDEMLRRFKGRSAMTECL